MYAVTDHNRKINEAVDTLTVNTDSTFYKTFRLEPGHYYLQMADGQKVQLLTDVGQDIVVSWNGEKYVVNGSPDTKQFAAYETFRKDVLEQLVYPIRRTISDLKREENPDESRIAEWGNQQLLAEQLYRDTLITQVRKMGVSTAIYPTIIRWEGDHNIPFYDSLANAFEKAHPELNITERIQEKVNLLKQIAIGGKATEIISKDVEGNPISLYGSLKTVTLVDFWASWCAPCRAQSEELNKLYAQYSTKGFEIVGVGIETDADRWKSAIIKDNRSWINVSDLEGYNTETAFAYSVTALPKNFLLDSNGVILAKDVHGEELESLLNELLP